MEKITKILEKYPFARRENLIPMLHDIQKEYGHLSENAIKELGQHLNIPTSKIYSLVTFYSKFRFQPKGKFHIKICRGTSCHLKGSSHLVNIISRELNISNGQTTKNGLFSLEVVACMGACGFGPVMEVNNKYYTSLNEDKLREVLEYYKESEE